MRDQIEAIVRWASLILGALILGACTIAGGSSGLIYTNWLGSVLGALVGFVGGAIVAGLFLGWVYVYFLLRRDLKAVQSELAKLTASARPDAKE